MGYEPSEPTVYWVDADDRVVEVGGGWDSFAASNDGEAVRGARVIGRPLWDFILGDATRMLVSTLLDGVRVHGRTLTRAYRCDSPRERRYMEMTLTPDGDRIRLEHRVLRVEPIAPSLAVRFAPKGRSYVRCSMCNAIRVDGEWMEASEARDEGRIPSAPPVVYGVCPRCLDATGEAVSRP